MEDNAVKIAEPIIDWVFYKKKARFQKLHEKHFEVVPDLLRDFRGMLAAFIYFFAYTRDCDPPTKQEQRKVLIDRANIFFKTFNNNRDCFDETICSLVDTFGSRFGSIMNEDYYSLNPVVGLGPGVARANKYAEIFNRMKNELDPLAGEIEKEFHKLLGSHGGARKTLIDIWGKIKKQSLKIIGKFRLERVK